MIRKEILDEAKKNICTDREQRYGKPEDNFRLIGELWGDYLRASMENPIRNPLPDEVAIMLALLKVARIATGEPHLDNFVDLIDYAACAGEIADKSNIQPDSLTKPTKPTLTEDEEIFVRWAVEFKFKYLAREQCGDLWIYENKPTRDAIWSHNVDTNAAQVNTDKYPFSFVKWEDTEPVYLPDLLGDCE